MSYSRALKTYQDNNLESQVSEANPHELVSLLIRGAIEKILIGKNFMLQNDTEKKGINISLAISIIDGLQSSLDKEKGGDLANNLFNLYDYMSQKLIESNLKNDPLILDEVLNLLETIRTGWDEISHDN